jgi:ribonucleotide monophosphatase NagD (HAD superfamily)
LDPPGDVIGNLPDRQGLNYQLLTNNPNFTNTANNNTMAAGGVSIAANPFRLYRTQAVYG